MSGSRRVLVALALLGALAGPTARAAAAPGQESEFQDDDALIFNTAAGTAATLDTLQTLGVDRIRVSVFWATVAPDAQSRTRPAGDLADPNAYPAGAWDRYDQVVRLAAARGIAVNFDITSPAPLWATGSDTPRADIAKTWQPDPAQYAKFVQAVGTRYSGSFAPASGATQRDDPPLCALLDDCPTAAPSPPGQPLPRVDAFSVWNEPNQAGWLTPQWLPGGVEASPGIYRNLVDAAYSGLQASGHGRDTFLVGETAPKGVSSQGTTSAMTALRFVRRLYCLDDKLHPLTGGAAAARGCPANPADFAAQHPGLFAATGFSHHPYELHRAPNVPPADPDFVTLADLPRLSTTLGRAFAAYGRSAAGLPLFLTEFGYNTKPPNPTGVSPAKQAAYLDQAEFMARSNPAVRSLAQFLLTDAPTRPDDGSAQGTTATFQTGLLDVTGRRKPAYAAYELPLFLPATRQARAGRLRIWGLVRPAHRIGAAQTVAIQLRRGGRTTTLANVRVPAATGVLDTRLRIPRSGSLRLAWRDPRSRATVLSRSVAVRVRTRR